MVYELKFFYWDDDPENDDYVIVAVYSSYELAEKGLEKFAEQPRFKGKKDFFNICDYKINEENSTWTEGFVKIDLTFFRIDLSGKYLMRKYEGEKIGIHIEGDTEDIFVKEINDYQDFGECTILRNRKTKKMYCFDKEKGSVLIETEENNRFMEYLNTNYGIEKIKWDPIFEG